MSSYKTCKKNFRELDKYGADVQLMFANRGSVYKTMPGAVFTLIAYTLIILAGFSEIQKTLDFAQPNVQTEEQIYIEEEIAEMKLSELNFIPLLRILTTQNFTIE